MTIHDKYMYRCIELAKQGAGNVAPNPMVGAVLVYNEEIIGEGYHQRFGEAHAEVNCINSVKKDQRSLISHSTLYVSLEPCSHFGKTPPCTDLIILQKIPKVVIGCRDPFKEVDGKGIEKLKQAGVGLIVGVLENECRELNKRFFCFHTKHRPYIILKWAQSADKKIAGAGSQRILISNEQTNQLVHKWRSEEASILVGTNTALLDDPELSTRSWPGNNPVRLVLDMKLSLPSSLKIFDGKVMTIVLNKIKNEEKGNIVFYQLKEEGNTIGQIMDALYQLNIQSVIVEGGAKLLQSFIDEGTWDEIRKIENGELRIENGLNAPQMKNARPDDPVGRGEWRMENEEKILTDTISYYRNKSMLTIHD